MKNYILSLTVAVLLISMIALTLLTKWALILVALATILLIGTIRFETMIKNDENNYNGL